MLTWKHFRIEDSEQIKKKIKTGIDSKGNPYNRSDLNKLSKYY